MKNQLLIITGANGQIGSFLAHRYSKSRIPMLLLVHKDSRRLAGLDGHAGILLKSCDLRDFERVAETIDSSCDVLDATPAYLVHTAAVRSYDAKPLPKSDPSLWTEIFDANLLAAYNILRASLPGMLVEQFGRIVLFGSNVVQTGLKNGSAYAAAKAAIVNLAQSVAMETASSDVLINAISPAPVQTEMEADFSGEYLAFRQRYFEEYRRQCPTGKLASKAEIGLFVDLLLNPGLGNCTGQNVVINGGSTTQIQQGKV